MGGCTNKLVVDHDIKNKRFGLLQALTELIMII